MLLCIAEAAFQYSGQPRVKPIFGMVLQYTGNIVKTRNIKNYSRTLSKDFRSNHDSRSLVVLFQVLVMDYNASDAI